MKKNTWKTILWNQDHTSPTRMDLVRKEHRKENVLIELNELPKPTADAPSHFTVNYLGDFGVKEFLLGKQPDWETARSAAIATVSQWLKEKRKAIDAQLEALQG